MERRDVIWIPGLLLLALGVLGLLGTLGLLGAFSALAWGALFGLAGLGFLAWFWQDRSDWWALIPAGTLLGLGLTVWVGAPWGGALFLGGIGLGFVAVFASERTRWWALVPAGSLLSLALVTLTGAAGGPVLFLGLATTFAAVWLASQRWALYPAVAFLMLAALSAGLLDHTGNLLWPLLLIGLGLFWLWPRQGGSPKH